MLSIGSQAADEYVRERVAQGGGSGSAPFNVSSAFASILSRDDPDVSRLITGALPSDMTASDLMASSAVGQGPFEQTGPGQGVTPEAAADLGDYDTKGNCVWWRFWKQSWSDSGLPSGPSGRP